MAERAAALIQRLTDGSAEPKGIGSFSVTVYDTAWVSMVAKKSVDGPKRWRFPECFLYLLDHQGKDGGWESYSSEVDGILNTMAALLALKTHAEKPHWSDHTLPDDIEERISKASDALQIMLAGWCVESCVHVGFEILVPTLLGLLEEKGMSFSMPGKGALMMLNSKKLAKFDHRMLYGRASCTLIHSLEAFIGKIDFDRVGHHKVGDSMLGSPSSTATYLIHASNWDVAAEDYLSMVMNSGEAADFGGMPSAYPTTTFMVCWSISTLLYSGFDAFSLGASNISRLADFLENQLHSASGVVGFAPGFLEDADDTAKTILTLNLLGRATSPDGMIALFEADNHFKTFALERNPSFSANCNVLIALLYAPEPRKYVAQIYKAANFLCNLWYEGELEDKWKSASQYTKMLLTQALVRMLDLWQEGHLYDACNDLIRDRVPIILTQIAVRTLESLETHRESAEITAYALLTLTKLSSLPWLRTLESNISLAIEAGRDLIRTMMENPRAKPEYLWIEKLTYSSPILRECYCLAALNISTSTEANSWKDPVLSLVSISAAKLSKFTQFFSKLPLFSSDADWLTHASIIEGYLLFPQLKRRRLDIFPRTDMVKDEYLEYIPMTWTLSNNHQPSPVGTMFRWEMMVVSMLNYQTDEYMEAVIGEKCSGDLGSVKEHLKSLCAEPLGSITCSIHSTDAESGTAERTAANQMERNCTLLDENDSSADSGWKRPHHSHINSNTTRITVHADVQKRQQNKQPTALTSTTTTTIASPPSSPPLPEIYRPLSKFISYILTHPLITHSHPSDKLHLRAQLLTFLDAHVTQIATNALFSAQNPSRTLTTSLCASTTPPYFDWVRSTSAAHTSCPYSFAFVACLISSGRGAQSDDEDDDGDDDGGRRRRRRPCFVGAWQKYLAADLVMHLATMCRQYNDYGSIVRDRAERNVNSVNFPEFHEGLGLYEANGGEESERGGEQGEDEIRTTLFEIAQYERECVRIARQRLEGMVSRPVRSVLGLFVDVTDLYGQIYVARDIASRMR